MQENQPFIPVITFSSFSFACVRETGRTCPFANNSKARPTFCICEHLGIGRGPRGTEGVQADGVPAGPDSDGAGKHVLEAALLRLARSLMAGLGWHRLELTRTGLDMAWLDESDCRGASRLGRASGRSHKCPLVTPASESAGRGLGCRDGIESVRLGLGWR